MALKKVPRRTKDDVARDLIDDGPPQENRFVLIVALLILLASIVLAFLTSRQTGDTFMTLSGGRDVVDGKLGQPDDWSFNTEGRVWIDQSWGTGVLYYVAWKQVGYAGIVIIKAVMICLIALFVVLAARQFGSNYSVAMIVAAYIVDAATSFIDMRANTLGLAMLAALLWMLYWSYGRPHRIWLPAALLTIWSHMHGSFVFGIAILGLWTVTHFAVLLWQGQRFKQQKQLWTLPAATALVIVLSVVTSPFGITNLIQPFSLMGLFVQEKWPLPANEMIPTFSDKPEAKEFTGARWYVFMLGCLAAIFVLRAIYHPAQLVRRLDDDASDRFTGQRIKWIFSFVLASITVVMAISARRFMPISLIACAPLVAYELQRLFVDKRFAWIAGLAIVGSVMLGGLLELIVPYMTAPPPTANRAIPPVDRRSIWTAAATVLALSPILGALIYFFGRHAWTAWLSSRPKFAARIGWITDRRRVSWAPTTLAAALAVILLAQVTDAASRLGRDPLNRNNDIFGRLIFLHDFPEEALEFLVENDIKGNVLNDRRWEGFIHWNHPELKVMFGGRSRQVYSPQAARDLVAAGQTKDFSLHAKMGISLAAIPVAKNKKIPATMLVEASPWRVIYYDGQSVIAANGDLPQSQRYILDADAGKLVYPSAKSATHSLAARRLAGSSTSSPDEVMNATVAATKVYPTPQLYQLLLEQLNKKNGLTSAVIVQFFESEAVRLHNHDTDQPLGFEELNSRQFIALTLKRAYANTTPPQPKRSEFWRKYARQMQSAAKALAEGSRETYVSEIPAEYVQLDQQQR